MPKGLQKSLQVYLAKLKKLAEPAPSSPNHTPTGTTNTTSSWLLSACKYPKTPSFAIDRNQTNGHGDAATLKDIDRFLFENFNSLYNDDVECDKGVVLCESPTYVKTPPNVRSSPRFFVPTGEVSSFIDGTGSSSASSSRADVPCTSSSSTPDDDDQTKLPSDTFAMLTFSRDPYNDFRQSMKEVVEAIEEEGSKPLDWDFFEELLFCYLNLNEKKAHKYILGAFVDLMVSFRPASGQTVPVIQERRKKKVHEKRCDVIMAGVSGGGQRHRKNR